MPLLLSEPIVLGVEKVVTQACSVQHQHAGGDLPLWRPQSWLTAGIESVKHLELAYIRRVSFGGRVEIEFTLLDTLHHRRTSDRFGGREYRKHRVSRHGSARAKHAFAERALIDVRGRVRDHRDDAGNAILAM